MIEDTPGQSAGQSVILLDLQGLKCPLPALRLRKALSRAASDTCFNVVCTDPMAAIDIPHLLRETGDVLEQQEVGTELLSFRVRKA